MGKYDHLTQNDLDDMVTEAKCWEASEINNQGRDKQIEFLIRWHGGEFRFEQSLIDRGTHEP